MPQKKANNRPIPSLGEADYETIMRFVQRECNRLQKRGQATDDVLTWVIQTLIGSLLADNAARLFLPKTQTAMFSIEDLIPMSAVTPSGQSRIQLGAVNLICPVWQDPDTVQEIASYASEQNILHIDDPVGVYIRELNLAIVDSLSEEIYASRHYGRGEAVFDVYSIRDMAPILSTDGTDWNVNEPDGSQTYAPVLEPRMAALYEISKYLYYPDIEKAQ